MSFLPAFLFFFFFNDTATTEIYTLSLHDALPICWRNCRSEAPLAVTRDDSRRSRSCNARPGLRDGWRSEEHTSELQSQSNLVCRLLLEKKKKHKLYEQVRCTNRVTARIRNRAVAV